MKMLCLRKCIILISFLFCCLISHSANPIKVLILTGQNNHNWQVSHIALKQILENSKLFSVDVIISPKEGEDMDEFKVNFRPYQLILLDYMGDNWPKTIQASFLEYVRNGGGVVAYHAANNAFPNWTEYNEMLALGGWNNRNEASGPWVYWQNDTLVKDDSPGFGGSHGKQHEYVLNKRSETHPIVKGLPSQWKHTTDELYDRMRGPGNIKDFLYTAHSDSSTGGSDREEPLIFTVEYGKGKVFHIMLGHAGESLGNNPSMQCAGFQTLILRGSEWAATGKVEQAIPNDFPTSSSVSYRKDYRAQ